MNTLYKKYEIVMNPSLGAGILFPTIVAHTDTGITVSNYQPFYRANPSFIFNGLKVGEHVEFDIVGNAAAQSPMVIASVPKRKGDNNLSDMIILSDVLSGSVTHVSFDVTAEMLNNRCIGVVHNGEHSGNPDAWYRITYTYIKPANLDGSDGNVMVELPAHYIKFEKDGNKRRVKLSERFIPGYEFRPLKYIAAFYSQRDNTTGTLMSVVNSTARFRGGNSSNAEEATWDDLPKTRIGKPSVNAYSEALPEISKNNSDTFDGYSSMSLVARETLHWFCTIEYATFNYKLPFNSEKTSEGYSQGGIGIGCTGVSGASLETHYSGNTPINNGSTISLGNQTGEVLYKEDLLGVAIKCNSYRGVENMCSNLRSYLHGVTFNTRIIETYLIFGTAQLDKASDVVSFSTKTTNAYGVRLNFDTPTCTFTEFDAKPTGSANTYTCSWSYIRRWSDGFTSSPYRLGSTISDTTNTSSLLSGEVNDLSTVAFPLVGTRLSYTIMNNNEK